MKKHLKQLDLKRIRITDSLFGEYVNKVSEKIIPHQWKILNDQLKIQSLPIVSIISVLPQVKKREREKELFSRTQTFTNGWNPLPTP